MTTPHPFAALVRRLDAEASKAPWEAVRKSVRVAGTGDSTGAPNGYGGGVCNCLGAGYGLSAGDEQNVRARANARAIVTLRNAAPEVAALVEAVEAYRVSVGRYDECAKAHPVGPHLAVLERQENTARGAMFAALDVEPTHHPDKMVTTYAILGLDDVRAAHRREVAEQVDAIRKERDEARGDARGNYLNILEVTALARTGTGPVKYADPVLEDAAAAVRVLLQERAAHAEAVRVAVEKEREACAKVCLDLRCRWCRELGEDTNGNHADCCACRDDAAAIRARGVAKPRTDGEAATRSGEGAKS